MVRSPSPIRNDYWESFSIEEADLEFLYNLLLEKETPMTSPDLVQALIGERIRIQKVDLESQQYQEGAIFLPKDHYEIGQTLSFPAFDWKNGVVINIRTGNNPDIPPFEVLEVRMDNGEVKMMASGVENHTLNQPLTQYHDETLFDPAAVFTRCGQALCQTLEKELNANPDLINIAGKWFAKSLLVDINAGHLNLAEAVLDMNGGGPTPTAVLMEQLDLSGDVNRQLIEFSLDYALEKDPRFDEVGPAGETLWFLHRLEPAEVQHPPSFLQYKPIEYNQDALTKDMLALEKSLDDELSKISDSNTRPGNEAVVTLTYPHWRSGTLPLTNRIQKFFPTAHEAPRIKFTLVDSQTNQSMDGWVVRPNGYIYGLKDWFHNLGLMPGSLIHITRGKKPGEVQIYAEKRRSNREWVKTVLIGADGGVVFALLKQMVNAAFDERMAIAISDTEALDKIWDNPAKQNHPLDYTVLNIMQELVKLSPQGNVHAQEIYAAVNVVRRCPPGPIFSVLASNPSFVHLGDLHFRIKEKEEE
ncbi:MAG TPA: hypothetical protein PKW33_04350 [Anaerolineaceae bacterium]|nr:hypothetical protein [Anaerolineaceae bacterium]HPN50794.1 hypothetical protein [Anaerolineaceae bacterium]